MIPDDEATNAAIEKLQARGITHTPTLRSNGSSPALHKCRLIIGAMRQGGGAPVLSH